MSRLVIGIGGIAIALVILLILALRIRRARAAVSQVQRDMSFNAGATLQTPAISISEDHFDADEVTRPGSPVHLEQTMPVSRPAAAAPVPADEDTRPVRPVRAPRKPTIKHRYPDPTDPYAGLFPPATPDDADYLESSILSDDTPPSGMKPVGDGGRPLVPSDQAPPDNLPL